MFVSQLTDDQLRNVREEFEQFDATKRGYITIKQVEHYYAKKLEQDRYHFILRLHLHSVYYSKQSTLTAHQMEFLLTRQSDYYKSCVDSFKSLDINGDATISFEEYLLKAAAHPEKYSDISFKVQFLSGSELVTKELKYRYTTDIALHVFKKELGVIY